MKKSKKLKTLDIVLIIVGILTILFTTVCMYFYYLFQSIPDTLVQMYYTTIVGELLVTGLIRITNTKYKKSEVNEDEL